MVPSPDNGSSTGRLEPRGVPSGGTPFFLLCLFLALNLAAPSRAASPAGTAPSSPAAPAGNTLPGTQRILLTADSLDYHEAAQSIHAQGHVRVWYASITLTAESADADLTTRRLQAEGDVVLVDQGKKIRCARLIYDLETRSAEAEGILFATYPWYYQGTRVDKQGEKNVTITAPNFTTCNARHPHYHLTASRIDIVLGESLTAYDAVLYIGTTPVFYLPWFWRSLRDSRPPFSIQVGYNEIEGAYVKTRFNYYLLEENYGSLLLDLMEKKGLGYGLEQHLHYRFAGEGDGDLSGFYIREKDTEVERSNLKLEHRHEFGPRDLLQVSVDYLSDRSFNREFSYDLVDSFQQKSYLAFSHRGDNYYLGVVAADTETLDLALNKYYPSSRQLPGLDFSLSPVKAWSWPSPLYFSLSSSLSRNYERVDVYGPGLDAEGNPVTLQQISYRFRDNLSFSPKLTQTFATSPYVLTQPSFSWSFAAPFSGYSKESLIPGYSSDDTQAPTRLDAAYSTSLSLTNKWVNYQRTRPTHLVQSRLSHSFTRRISHLDEAGVALAGVSSNSLGLGLDYFAGSVLSLQASTNYNLLPVAGGAGWSQRLSPLNLNGRAAPWEKLNFSWQGLYDWTLGRINSGYFAANTFGSKWSAFVNGSYSYRLNNPKPDAIYATAGGNYAFDFGLSVQTSVQYDFTEKRFNNITLGVSHDLHCWELQAGFVRYLDGRSEIGAGITLKAFPTISAGKAGAGGFNVGEY